MPEAHPIVTAIVVLTPYGVVFFGATLALGVGEASAAVARVPAAVALRGACGTAEIAENAELSNHENKKTLRSLRSPRLQALGKNPSVGAQRFGTLRNILR
jgi:hypothetical protein